MPRVSRMRCAYADPFSIKPKRTPAKKRSEMTEEEKEDADVQKLARAGLKIAKEEWEKSLGAPWAGPNDFRWPKDTVGIYKSDAKSSFGLTDKDVQTLRHEAISGSSKTFYSLVDVKNLSAAKFMANALPINTGLDLPGVPKNGYVRIFKKADNPTRRTRTNWMDIGNTSWQVYQIAWSKNDPQAMKEAQAATAQA